MQLVGICTKVHVFKVLNSSMTPKIVLLNRFKGSSQPVYRRKVVIRVLTLFVRHSDIVFA